MPVSLFKETFQSIVQFSSVVSESFLLPIYLQWCKWPKMRNLIVNNTHDLANWQLFQITIVQTTWRACSSGWWSFLCNSLLKKGYRHEPTTCSSWLVQALTQGQWVILPDLCLVALYGVYRKLWVTHLTNKHVDILILRR